MIRLLLLCFLTATVVSMTLPTRLPENSAAGSEAPTPVNGLVSQSDSIYFSQFSYIYLLGDDDQLVVTDDDFYQHAQKVNFVVSKYDININSHAIQELVNKIIPRINADSLQLEYMMIRGAASPDGSYSFNQFLSKNRAKALFDFINSRLLFPAEEKRYSQTTVAEDYVDLCRMMQKAHDPLTGKISSIVDRYSESGDLAGLKNELKALNRGRTWKYMLHKYFPELRSAKVMFFFKKYKPEGQKKAVRIISKRFDYSAPMQPLRMPATAITAPTPPAASAFTPVLTYDDTLDSILYRRHILAVRTNLLYDFFYMPGHYWAPSPNIQLEYYPKTGHFTTNLSITYPHWHWWNRYQFWQIHDYMLEERFYFKGKGRFIGPYVSAYGHINRYGLGFSKEEGYEGEGFGGGLMVGWVFNISKNRRWRMEVSAGVGYYETRYDPYVYGNPLSGEEDGLYYYDYTGAVSAFKERNYRFRWIGPTNLGIHITYDLLFRRIQKRGVSFNRSEKVIPEDQRTRKVVIDRKGVWR